MEKLLTLSLTLAKLMTAVFGRTTEVTVMADYEGDQAEGPALYLPEFGLYLVKDSVELPRIGRVQKVAAYFIEQEAAGGLDTGNPEDGVPRVKCLTRGMGEGEALSRLIAEVARHMADRHLEAEGEAEMAKQLAEERQDWIQEGLNKWTTTK